MSTSTFRDPVARSRSPSPQLREPNRRGKQFRRSAAATWRPRQPAV